MSGFSVGGAYTEMVPQINIPCDYKYKIDR